MQLVLGYGYDKLVKEPEPPLPAPSEITLNVYNTTWKEGLASEVADDLRDRGFKIKATGNDPQMSFLEKEVAIIRFGPEGQRSAKRLAQQIEGAQLQKDDRTSRKVDLVLGNKFERLKPESRVPQVKPYVRPAETIQKPACPRLVTVRTVGLLTAGGIAPCLSSAVGGSSSATRRSLPRCGSSATSTGTPGCSPAAASRSPTRCAPRPPASTTSVAPRSATRGSS